MAQYGTGAASNFSTSIDDPTFANAVPARIDGSSWTVAVPTPSVGTHTVYARSTQGYDTSSTASSTFTVTK